MSANRSITFIITLTITLLSTFVHSQTVPATVVSLPRVNPVIVGDTVRVSTVVRGAAANQPARVVTSIVPKSRFLPLVRGVLSRAANPWAIGAVAVGGFIVDQLNDLQADLYKQPDDSPIGSCHVYTVGYTTYQDKTYKQCEDITRQQRCMNPPCRIVYGSNNKMYWRDSRNILNADVSFNPYSIQPPIGEPQLLTDDELWEFINDYVNQNPDIDHTQMFKDADAQIIPEYFPDTQYNPSANEDDLTLVDLYNQGLLQSTDPSAPHYLPPERLQEIANLAAEIAHAQTPEGEADAINEELRQPITQSQFEESSNTLAEQGAQSLSNSNTDTLDKTTELDNTFDLLNNAISNTQQLPSELNMPALPQYSSTCRVIQMEYKGHSVTFPSTGQCDKLNQAKELLAYLLSVLTALAIIFACLRGAN